MKLRKKRLAVSFCSIPQKTARHQWEMLEGTYSWISTICSKARCDPNRAYTYSTHFAIINSGQIVSLSLILRQEMFFSLSHAPTSSLYKSITPSPSNKIIPQQHSPGTPEAFHLLCRPLAITVKRRQRRARIFSQQRQPQVLTARGFTAPGLSSNHLPRGGSLTTTFLLSAFTTRRRGATPRASFCPPADTRTLLAPTARG